MKRFAVLGAILCFLISMNLAAQQAKTPPKGKKEFVFKGKVEKIDLANKTFTVHNERVTGWMDAMSMNYVPDREDVLKKVKVGDQITAKVYDGDFRTLYSIEVVPPAKGQPATPGKK